MFVKTTLYIIICFCLQHDPQLHHHASQSGEPLMSPQTASSARLTHADLGHLPVRIDNSMYNVVSFSLLLLVAAIVPPLPRSAHKRYSEKIRNNLFHTKKQIGHHYKVLQENFYLNGYTVGFHSQTKTLEPHYTGEDFAVRSNTYVQD